MPITILISTIKSKLKYERFISLLRKIGFFTGFAAKREKIAQQFLCGEGIEIGALDKPLDLPKSVKVTHVDVATQQESEAKFPQLKGKIVKAEIIDDGFKLLSVQEKSQDFLIANHVLEHSSNPIQTLMNWGRCLKIGGLLFITIPIAAHCFDRGRKLTTLEHMIEDYRVGYNNYRQLQERNKEHYAEWISISEPNIFKQDGLPRNNLSRIELLKRVNLLAEQNDERDAELHFHTFSNKSFEKLLKHFATQYSMEFDIIIVAGIIYETVAVLRRRT